MLEMVLGLLVVALIIAMFGVTIFLIVDLFRDFNFMTLLLTIIVVVMCLIPVGVVYDTYQKDNAQQQIIETDVEIVKKVYHPPSTRLIISGKSTIIVPVSAKYLLTIKSNIHTQTIDNKDTYDAFEVGDRFKMNLIQYADENGKVFTQEFDFIE